MSKKVLSFSNGTIPKIPPKSEWRKAPFLGEHDRFWDAIEEFTSGEEIPSKPLLIHPEGNADLAMVVPASIPRFIIERGDTPFSFIDYETHINSNSTPEWKLWSQHILSQKRYRTILNRAEILQAIQLFSVLSVKHDVDSLTALISRWSSISHTFFTAWGEFTPTLEDVVVLFCLPIFGSQEANSSGGGSNEEEAKIIAYLEESADIASKKGSWFKRSTRLAKQDTLSSSKLSYSAWLRYFFKDFEPVDAEILSNIRTRQFVCGPEYGKDHELAAYLAYWLDRYVFQRRHEDDLNRSIFPLAAIISRGVVLPLAPLFLGTLYGGLDTIVADFSRSLGRYEISTLIPCNFLMIFLFERFPSYAAMDDQTLDKGQAMRWYNLAARGHIGDFLDNEDEFVWRPYTIQRIGIQYPRFYEDEDIVVSGEPSMPQLMFAAMINDCYLPVMDEVSLPIAVYNPSRVARQLGFDQGVPIIPADIGDDFDSCCSRYRKSRELRTRSFSCFKIPAARRKGHCSLGYLDFWGRVHLFMMAFVNSTPSIPDPITVFKGDVTLKCSKSRKSRGNRGRFAKAIHSPISHERSSRVEPIGKRLRRTPKNVVNYTEPSLGIEESLPASDELATSTDPVSETGQDKVEATLVTTNHDVAEDVPLALFLSSRGQKPRPGVGSVNQEETVVIKDGVTVPKDPSNEIPAESRIISQNSIDKGGDDVAIESQESDIRQMIFELGGDVVAEFQATIDDATVFGDNFFNDESLNPQKRAEEVSDPRIQCNDEDNPCLCPRRPNAQAVNPQPQPQPQAVEDDEAENFLHPISFTPDDVVQWQSFSCSFRSVGMLNRILQHHPQTFVGFTMCDEEFQRLLLDALADFLFALDGKSLSEIDDDIVKKARGQVADWKRVGLELSWLECRLSDVIVCGEIQKLDETHSQLLEGLNHNESELVNTRNCLAFLEDENADYKREIGRVSRELSAKKQSHNSLPNDSFFKSIL